MRDAHQVLISDQLRLKRTSTRMRQIDGLNWATGLALNAYGVRVGIRVNDPRFVNRLHQLLPPGWKSTSSPVVEQLFSLIIEAGGTRSGKHRFNQLYENDTQVAQTFDLDQVFEILESSVRMYVAEWARGRVFVHAGVVGWRGRAIVIPGRSFSGKTTMVAELVRAGASYYSDEYAVFDARGRVHPFAKPLSIREGSAAKQVDYRAEALGGATGIKPLPVGLIVVSNYKPGAHWRPREISAGQGALALLDNAVAARRQPAAVLQALQQAVIGVPILKGVRGEARETVDSILKQLEGSGGN